MTSRRPAIIKVPYRDSEIEIHATSEWRWYWFDSPEPSYHATPGGAIDEAIEFIDVHSDDDEDREILDAAARFEEGNQ